MSPIVLLFATLLTALANTFSLRSNTSRSNTSETGRPHILPDAPARYRRQRL